MKTLQELEAELVVAKKAYEDFVQQHQEMVDTKTRLNNAYNVICADISRERYRIAQEQKKKKRKQYYPSMVIFWFLMYCLTSFSLIE